SNSCGRALSGGCTSCWWTQPLPPIPIAKTAQSAATSLARRLSTMCRLLGPFLDCPEVRPGARRWGAMRGPHESSIATNRFSRQDSLNRLCRFLPKNLPRLADGLRQRRAPVGLGGGVGAARRAAPLSGSARRTYPILQRQRAKCAELGRLVKR